ncbi:MAG: formylglycine-generating enzyme family protein [Planctomycetota bacterium]
MRSQTGRAELLRSLKAGVELDDLAAWLGYSRVPEDEETQTEEQSTEAIDETLPKVPLPPPAPEDSDESAKRPFEPILFWRPESVSFTDPEDVPPPATSGFSRAELIAGARADAPPKESLSSWSRLSPKLHGALSRLRRAGVDEHRIARAVSSGESLKEVPYRSRRIWSSRAVVVVDHAEHLTPFWGDQDEVVAALRRIAGSRLEVHTLLGGPRGVLMHEGRVERRGLEYLKPGTPLLVLSDLGFYRGDELSDRWLRLGRELRRSGIRPLALIPCPQGRWRAQVAELWNGVVWDRSAGASARSPDELLERSERLLGLASAAKRIEPGLLRALRGVLGSDADVGTEADAWNQGVLSHARGMVLGTETREYARALVWLGEEEVEPGEESSLRTKPCCSGETVKRAAKEIQRWHRDSRPMEVWLEEVFSVSPTEERARELGLEDDREEAVKFLERMAETVKTTELDDNELRRLFAWCRRVEASIPRTAREDSRVEYALRRILIEIRRRMPDVDLTSPLPTGEPRWYELHQETHLDGTCELVIDGTLVLTTSGIVESRGRFPISRLWASDEVFVSAGKHESKDGYDLTDGEARIPIKPSTLLVETGHSTLKLELAQKPPWATGIGRDRFGLYAAIQVEKVEHRLRWIEPGRYLRGSPESDEERFSDEGPQHEVTISRGFWLGETPCTQDLWEAVMGENPSQRQGFKRPVECVSWNDTKTFFERLEQSLPGFGGQLPTEAQWEFACRAGTTTSRYVGESERLDEIAWYSGHSREVSTDVELYDEGTQNVKILKPNAWGLYDMLGNVFEWCSDRSGVYSGPVSDPTGPGQGEYRVARGGSWISPAQYARSAYRDGYHPDSGLTFIGFRLSPAPAAPSEPRRQSGGATPRRERADGPSGV